MRPRDERVGGRGRASSPSEAPRGGAHARRAGLEARARGSDPRGGARARARALRSTRVRARVEKENPGEDTAVCVRAPGRLCDNRFAGRGRRGRGLRHAPRPTRPRWSRRRPRPPSRRPPTERTPPLPARLRSPPRPCSHLPPRAPRRSLLGRRDYPRHEGSLGFGDGPHPHPRRRPRHASPRPRRTSRRHPRPRPPRRASAASLPRGRAGPARRGFHRLPREHEDAVASGHPSPRSVAPGSPVRLSRAVREGESPPRHAPTRRVVSGRSSCALSV